MKLSLLVSILLLTSPVQAGNLGAADHVRLGIRGSKSEFTDKRTFDVYVKGSVRGSKKKTQSVATFADGKFKILTNKEHLDYLVEKDWIDSEVKLDESGVTPDQVISFDWDVTPNFDLYSLLYRDSDSEISFATWFFVHDSDRVKAFHDVFLQWLSGKL